jgi:prepilin signal peptidase PulO-like enzyme (type II secretory pathway)
MSPGRLANIKQGRDARFFVMMGSIALAVPLMLLFDTLLTRLVGVALLFTFVVAGVFAIADHEFLAEEDE